MTKRSYAFKRDTWMKKKTTETENGSYEGVNKRQTTAMRTTIRRGGRERNRAIAPNASEKEREQDECDAPGHSAHCESLRAEEWRFEAYRWLIGSGRQNQ